MSTTSFRGNPEEGPTSTTLALICKHHHHLVHRKGWTMKGNANEELTFIGPTGRIMTSRPSPLWTRVTAGVRSGPSDGAPGEA